MRSYDFIEMFKKHNDLASDYKAAKELGITRQSISLYKNGRPIDEDLALPIAESLGIEPSEILIVIAGERSKSPKARKAWAKLAKLTKQSGKATTKLLITLPFSFILIQYLYIMLNNSRKLNTDTKCKYLHRNSGILPA